MTSISSTTFPSRSFAGARQTFWRQLVAAMPIVIFWRGLRQALAR